MHVLHVVGARPNFMKVAPVHAALARRGAEQTIVHTGQHYDAAMSDVFFHELGIPEPDINLEVGSKSHSAQTAEVMIRFEPVVGERRPDWVLVYGDVNSTVAAALVCAKLLVKIAHVEAGLRSRDRTMPEEINRLVTDQIANLLFTPSEDGDENLRAEGIPAERIVRVGNVMIDTLLRLRPFANERWPRLRDEMLPRAHARGYGFALLTMHRPSNVDDTEKLERLLRAVSALSERLPIVFPIHPRTREQIKRSNLRVPETLKLTDPLGYLDFLALQQHATLVITDSGGVQEETTALGIPCLTLRANTERPVTVTIGTNVLIGDDLALLGAHFDAILDGRGKRGEIPPLWDGRASERIADALFEVRNG